MKKIKYQILGYLWQYNPETEEVEQVETLVGVIKDYTEANEEIAKREAYDDVYDTYDVEEPEAQPTDAERITELEEALAMLLSGVVE